MQPEQTSLAALIGSRICHDLINPIGAISNGLELVAMTAPTPDTPEMTLIQQSCDNASARIRFFRIAFGSTGDQRVVPAVDAHRTLAAHYTGTRITPVWDIDRDVPRSAVQFGYLAVLCLETALPQGGVISVSMEDGVMRATAQGVSVTREPSLWNLLRTGVTDARDLRPAHVQFGLLAQLCAECDTAPSMQVDGDSAQLSIRLPAVASMPALQLRHAVAYMIRNGPVARRIQKC